MYVVLTSASIHQSSWSIRRPVIYTSNGENRNRTGDRVDMDERKRVAIYRRKRTSIAFSIPATNRCPTILQVRWGM